MSCRLSVELVCAPIAGILAPVLSIKLGADIAAKSSDLDWASVGRLNRVSM